MLPSVSEVVGYIEVAGISILLTSWAALKTMQSKEGCKVSSTRCREMQMARIEAVHSEIKHVRAEIKEVKKLVEKMLGDFYPPNIPPRPPPR